MAFTKFFQGWKGRSGKESLRLNGDRTVDIVTEYEEFYTIETDTKTNSSAVILAHPSLPLLGTPHPDDPSATLRTRQPTQRNEAGTVWRVRLLYSTDTPDIDLSSPDPLSKPAIRTIQGINIQKTMWQDLDGRISANLVGEPVNPPTVEYPGKRLSFTLNLPSLNAADALAENTGAVNSVEWFGHTALTVKFDDFRVTERYEQGTSFAEATWVFLWSGAPSPTGSPWDYEPVHQGFYTATSWVDETFADITETEARAKQAASQTFYAKTRELIKGPDNLPLRKPGLLDEIGKVIEVEDTLAVPKFLTFRIRNRLDFALFGLGGAPA